MENESLKPSEKKPSQQEQKIDPFEKLRGHLKQAKANGLMKKDLYLVLDASSSMNSYCDGRKSKIQAVKDVVQNVISEYSAKVMLHLIDFSEDAQEIQSLQDYRSRGETNIQVGLQMLSANSQSVLLSDGGETAGHARHEIPRLVENHITVNCIGVGIDPSGEKLLRDIAEATGGLYAGIDANVDQIFATFKKLTSKAVAALTAGKQAIEAGGSSE